MKNRSIGVYRFGAICALICLAAAVPARAAQTNAVPPIIRLHVLAVSDKKEDQEKKLVVRDAVLGATDALLGECENYGQAYSILDERLEDVLAAAQGAAEGVRVRAELTTERYPDREYARITLPAGSYTSLKIILGEGEGQNWWCVVYPSLCGLTEADVAVETQAPPLRLGFWDWITRLVFGEERAYA